MRATAVTRVSVVFSANMHAKANVTMRLTARLAANPVEQNASTAGALCHARAPAPCVPRLVFGRVIVLMTRGPSLSPAPAPCPAGFPAQSSPAIVAAVEFCLAATGAPASAAKSAPIRIVRNVVRTTCAVKSWILWRTRLSLIWMWIKCQ